MIVNLNISTQEPLQYLMQRVLLLYMSEGMRNCYTILKTLNQATDGPEMFCQESLKNVPITLEEKDMVTEAFITTLMIQGQEQSERMSDE